MQTELKAMRTEPRGQNKVSALAKNLASKFKEAEPVASRSESVKPSVERCFFCKDKVYLVERYTAEGVFFHRACFRCDYCGESLRIGAHVFVKSDGLEGRFYCQQHSGLKARPRRRRAHRSQAPPPVNTTVRDSADGLAPKATPERVEYMTESEVEESEWEQTSHNLSASLLDLGEQDKEDSDSSE